MFSDGESFQLGKIVSIEKDKKPVEQAKKGEEVSVKIVNISSGPQKMYGRHFNEQSTLVSELTRDTIDVLKNYYRSEMSNDYWRLVKKLKIKLGIE